MFKLAIKSQLCPTKLTNQPEIATLSFGETKFFWPGLARAGAPVPSEVFLVDSLPCTF
jgi:hypothetical protein